MRKRKRVSRDQVRENAKKSEGGGSRWLNLPDGIETWKPEKEGTVALDILPYEVSTEKHPENIEKGTVWYKTLFTIHRGIGPNNDAVVCPRSVGKKCPIHEELENLKRSMPKGEKIDSDTWRQLNGQRMVAMNMRDPSVKKKVKVRVYVDSAAKFWGADAGLKVELEKGDDGNLSFFDVKDGKTLKVRFTEASFDGGKFLQATRVDFVDREDLDEDLVLKRTVDLDKALNVMPYDRLKALFLQTDDEDEGKKAKVKKSKKSHDEEE